MPIWIKLVVFSPFLAIAAALLLGWVGETRRRKASSATQALVHPAPSDPEASAAVHDDQP